MNEARQVHRKLNGRLVAATHNSGKLREFRELLAPWRIEVVSAENCQPGQEVFSVASLGGEKRCADAGMVTYTGPFDAVWEFMLERSLFVTRPVSLPPGRAQLVVRGRASLLQLIHAEEG